jgi:hypothetical protein
MRRGRARQDLDDQAWLGQEEALVGRLVAGNRQIGDIVAVGALEPGDPGVADDAAGRRQLRPDGETKVL